MHRPLVYGAANVRKRHDGTYCVYVVLNYSDAGLATADDALRAAMDGLIWLNPLKWIQVAVAKNFELAKAEARRWKTELKKGSRPNVRSDLITT